MTLVQHVCAMLDQPRHRRSANLQDLANLLLQRQFVRPNHVLN